MKKKLIRHIIISVLIVFAYGCSKAPSPPQTTINLLLLIKHHTFPETQLVDFRKDFNAKKFLLRGWAKPEKEYTWTQGRTNAIYFYSYERNKDLQANITCQSIPLTNNLNQTMTVTVNGEKLSPPIIVSPLSFKEYRLTIPVRHIKTGYNVLQFQTSVTKKPQEIFPNFTSNIPIAVAFKKIRITNQSNITFTANTLSQSSGSQINFYSKLPQSFSLHVRYSNPTKITSSIEIKPANGKNIIINLPTGKGEYQQNIQTDGGVSELILKSFGNNTGNTIWEKITASPSNIILTKAVITKKKPTPIKPDILLYVVDALRSDHLHSYNYARETSPNIDQFAAENSLFLNAYSHDSWTKPSAASILTGLYPKHHGATGRDNKLPSDLTTIAEYLHDNGYFTAGFVANGNLSHVFGFNHGFDIYQEHFNLEETTPLKGSVQSTELNEYIFDFLNQYTHKKDRQPLFMLVWTIDPHAPYTPNDKVKKLFNIEALDPIDTYVPRLIYKLRIGEIKPTPSQLEYIKTRYDQEIFSNDESFGALLNKLKELQLYTNSLIVFTGDHGEEFLEHGGAGHGRTLYNEQIKIPLIIKSPQIKKGLHKQLVQHMDIFPTIVDTIGGDTIRNLDGESILKNNGDDRTLFFEEDLDRNEVWAILDKDKKLVFNKRVNRSATGNDVPYLEIYTTNGKKEENPLQFSGPEDQLMLQELSAYRENRQQSTNVQKEKAAIPLKLDNKLKELGYIK